MTVSEFSNTVALARLFTARQRSTVKASGAPHDDGGFLSDWPKGLGPDLRRR
jgi:hypothetical protein